MIVFSPDATLDIERLRLFLDQISPEAAQKALASILIAVEKLQDFPNLGRPIANSDIRQIVVRFGSSGYIIRYAILANSNDIFVTRVWHSREQKVS